MQFQANSWVFASRFDSLSGNTQIYEGDFDNYRIVRYDIDPLLNRTEVPLPLLYGEPWLAVDLDLDGKIELVIQRGDEGGFGGNGYLDIHSAPDWQLRTRFVMPGMKTYMHPEAVNIDDDPYLELYLTPNSVSGGLTRAQLIKFDPSSGQFVRIADVAAPSGTSGESAVGDFDNDGRMEFITGNFRGYGLFEYDGLTLRYIGPVIDDGFISNNFYGTAVRPIPGEGLMALLGHSSIQFRYRLMRAIGDNTFEIVHDFIKSTGWSGSHPNYAADVDCDGIDEMLMSFYPIHEVWEWNEDSQEFVPGCTYDASAYGASTHLGVVDLNQNGRPEWAAFNSVRVFNAFEDDRCSACLRIPDMTVWWPFDQTSGSHAPDIVGGMSGEIRGSPATVSGQVSSALEFNGTGDCIRVADGAVLDIGDSDFTIEAWVRTGAVLPRNPIISHWDYVHVTGWSLCITNGNQLCFLAADDASATQGCGPSGMLSNGVWHHVAVTVDRTASNTVRLYLDGVQIGSASFAAVAGEIRPEADLLIAAEALTSWDTSFFDGALDEATLYRGALDPGTIRALYETGAIGKCKTWVSTCDCSGHGDVAANGGSPDVTDVAAIIDYVFGGGPQLPIDSNCPHVDRGDVNCDGQDDISDVVTIISIAFRGANRAPCNPCGCLPYPSQCQ